MTCAQAAGSRPSGSWKQIHGQVRPGQESPGRGTGLGLPFGSAGQQDVAGLQRTGGQLQQQPARAYLHVVGVRADGEQGQRPTRGRLQAQ